MLSKDRGKDVAPNTPSRRNMKSNGPEACFVFWETARRLVWLEQSEGATRRFKVFKKIFFLGIVLH